ncbi:hypothetical protein Sste5344_003724 [Sporothrix stenoceras]
MADVPGSLVPQGSCDGAADDEAEAEEETEEADSDEDNDGNEDTEEDTDARDGLQSDAVAAPAQRRPPKPTIDENLII